MWRVPSRTRIRCYGPFRALGREVSLDDIIWYVGDQRKDVVAALRVSATGPQVRPIACGIRASLAIVEHGLGTDQIMLTMDDLRVALS
jgi:phosphoglycolate phosphatase